MCLCDAVAGVLDDALPAPGVAHLRQVWRDERLQFPGNRNVTLNHKQFDRMWTPDVFIRNLKSGSFHTITVPGRHSVTAAQLTASSGHAQVLVIPLVPLETSEGVLSSVDVVVLRRDGPRRLRDHDEDHEAPRNHFWALLVLVLHNRSR